MIPTTNPPKVKLENFHNSRVLELGEIMHILVCEGIRGFYSSVELTFVSWWRESFLIGKILVNACILRKPFLIRNLSIWVNRGV